MYAAPNEPRTGLLPASHLKNPSALAGSSISSTKVPTQFKTMTGAKDGSFALAPLEKTADARFRLVAGPLAAAAYTSATSPRIVGGLSCEDLVRVLQQGSLKVKIIDVRERRDADTADAGSLKKRRFAGSLYSSMMSGDPNFPPGNFATSFQQLAKAPSFPSVRDADLVVVHCAAGEQRSPAILALYTEYRLKNKAVVNANQRVALLNGGFDRVCETHGADTFGGLIVPF
ncbi:hypothetical protein JCM9279_000462 [Rhodotorula babjevae]